MGESTSRYSRLSDGRILDSDPMGKGKSPAVFENGMWIEFKGTVGEWRHSKPLTASEVAILTSYRAK